MPAAIHDLPLSAYPLEIQAFDTVTGEEVWSKQVHAPMRNRDVIRIPNLREECGHPVRIRITFGDGTVKEMDPPPVQ